MFVFVCVYRKNHITCLEIRIVRTDLFAHMHTAYVHKHSNRLSVAVVQYAPRVVRVCHESHMMMRCVSVCVYVCVCVRESVLCACACNTRVT